MKKICALFAACLMLLSACSLLPASTEGSVPPDETSPSGTEQTVSLAEEDTTEDPRKEIVIWTFANEEELTKELCAEYFEENAAEAGEYTVTVKPVNAEDLIARVGETADPAEGGTPAAEGMPDLFFFYSDDYDTLRKEDLLSAVPQAAASRLKTAAAEAGITAASDEEGMFAYPASLDNTMLLYYDKSIVSDASELSSVIKQCGEKGRCFYVGTEIVPYPALLFLSCGLTYEADMRLDGSIESVNCDYYTEKGLQAAKMMQSLMSMPAFRGVEGSPILAFTYTEEQAGAMIADSCQTQDLKTFLGENYAVAALPEILFGKEKLPEISRGSFTLIGVSPKADEEKLSLCHKLAEYLISDKAQLSRYTAKGTVPVSLSALKDKALKGDETASALREQMPNVIRKVKRSDGYTEAMNRFTQQLLQGGAEIKTARLQQLLDELSAFLMADGAKAKERPSENN